MLPRLLSRLIRNIRPSPEPSLTRLNLGELRIWREQYPDVPKPETKLSIQLIAARWACHDLHGEEMPGIAADFLEAGLDSPALIRLAGETQVSCSADVEGLVGRVIREFCLPYPFTENQAQLILSRQIAREVIAGDRDPWRAANYLEKVLWGRRPVNPDLETLFDLNDELEWDTEYKRYVPVTTADLLDTFARLGKLSDAQIFTDES